MVIQLKKFIHHGANQFSINGYSIGKIDQNLANSGIHFFNKLKRDDF